MFAAAGESASAETVEWALATGYPESSFHVANLHRFASEVEKATSGKLRIKIHPGGSLVKAGDIRGALDKGTIAAGELFGPSLAALHPALAVDALPFLATDYRAAQRLSDAARDVVRAQLLSHGYVLLYSVSWPPQGLFSAKPIESQADFEGLRIRENSPPVKRLVELIGGKPVRVETPDLAAAVRDGKVDAVFTSAAQGIDTAMGRQLPHFYTANAWLPRNVVLVQKNAFDALDPALRAIVMRTAVAAEVNGQKLSEENAKSTLEQLRASGEKIDTLPTMVRRRLDQAGKAIVKEAFDAQQSPDLLLVLGKFFSGAK